MTCQRCGVVAVAIVVVQDAECQPRDAHFLCAPCLSFVEAAIAGRPVYSAGLCAHQKGSPVDDPATTRKGELQ